MAERHDKPLPVKIILPVPEMTIKEAKADLQNNCWIFWVDDKINEDADMKLFVQKLKDAKYNIYPFPNMEDLNKHFKTMQKDYDERMKKEGKDSHVVLVVVPNRDYLTMLHMMLD